MTRLIDLSPKWTGISVHDHWPEKPVSSNIKFGITFLCPHCRKTKLGIFFKPFIDPENLAPLIKWKWPDAPNPNTGEIKNVLYYQRSGSEFESLTLLPSISVAHHWHGNIIGGNVFPA